MDQPRTRCTWCGNDPRYVAYHDHEWGRPVHNDQQQFEMLTLEGAQAGLSWLTILRKRDGYRAAFDGFDLAKVAAYTSKDQARLLIDSRIVRNRLKIVSTIRKAKGILRIQHEFGSFDAYLWQFVDGAPIVNQWRALSDLPAQTALSDQVSKDLKKRGFTFVGSTICYAFMQAIGMVNDHTKDCFRHPENLPVGR